MPMPAVTSRSSAWSWLVNQMRSYAWESPVHMTRTGWGWLWIMNSSRPDIGRCSLLASKNEADGAPVT